MELVYILFRTLSFICTISLGVDQAISTRSKAKRTFFYQERGSKTNPKFYYKVWREFLKFSLSDHRTDCIGAISRHFIGRIISGCNCLSRSQLSENGFCLSFLPCPCQADIENISKIAYEELVTFLGTDQLFSRLGRFRCGNKIENPERSY